MFGVEFPSSEYFHEMNGKLRTNPAVAVVISVTACSSFRWEFLFQGSGAVGSVCAVLEWPQGKTALLSLPSYPFQSLVARCCGDG